MRKKIDTDGKKNSSSVTKNKDISEIRSTIDGFLHKNTPERFSAEKISPENRERDSIYHISRGNKGEFRKDETRKEKREKQKRMVKKLNKAKIEEKREKRRAKKSNAEKAEKEKQKQKEIELAEARDKVKKAKIEKKKQEKLDLAEAKAKAKPPKISKDETKQSRDSKPILFGKAKEEVKLDDEKRQTKRLEEQKKAKLEAKEKEREAKQAKIEEKKQEKLDLAKAKDEAKQAEIEKQKQEKETRKLKQEDQKKAKLEAKEKEREAKQAEKEMDLAKAKDEAKPPKISKGETEQARDSKPILFGKTKEEVKLDDEKKQTEKLEKVKVKTLKTSKDKKHLRFGKKKKESMVKPPMPHIPKTGQNIISEEPEIEDAEKLKRNTLAKLGFLEKGSWEELDFHPLIEPFAYALVIRKTETLDNLYIVVEIELTKEESEKLELINEVLSKFTVDTNELESKGKDKYLKEEIDQIIEDYTIKLGATSKKKITYFLKKELLGLGKLEPLMKDPNIEDISCDSSDVPLFIYHRNYGSLVSSVKFADEDELSSLVVKLSQKCGKHISIAKPMLDATMPDGSRIQMTLSSEITTKGSTFTIRRFKENPFSPSDLIEFNTMSAGMLAYMWIAVEHGANALIAGGTASGKTSTLNALALFIPPESKIVTIEETREINLPHSNWIPGVARSGFGEVVGGKVTGEIDMYDLMKAALRQRPEYILVGEIRGRESYVLFQAMATGHTTYSTVHADSTKSLIHRLEGEPINIPRIMLQSLDIVCIQTISRVKNKRARRCKQIIEIIDIDPSTKEILTNEVFHWDPVEDKFIYSGKSYVLERVRAEKNQSREEITNELGRRAELLGWMTKKNIKEFKEVASMIANYIDTPSKIMTRLKEDKGR